MSKSVKFIKETEFEKFLTKCWKELRFDLKKMFNWYFFYRPKNSADKVWHFIGIVITDIILLKVFGLI